MHSLVSNVDAFNNTSAQKLLRHLFCRWQTLREIALLIKFTRYYFVMFLQRISMQSAVIAIVDMSVRLLHTCIDAS